MEVKPGMMISMLSALNVRMNLGGVCVYVCVCVCVCVCV